MNIHQNTIMGNCLNTITGFQNYQVANTFKKSSPSRNQKNPVQTIKNLVI